MTGLIAAIDTVAFAAFVYALVVYWITPEAPETPFNKTARMCVMIAMGVYVFAMFSNTIEHVGFPQLDPAEDYIELLFPPFVFYATYAVSARQREVALMRSERAAQRSREMMLEIVDTAPAGVLVVSASGAVVFANETAREVLDLVEDSVTCALVHGEWTIIDETRPVGAQELPDLGALVHGRTRRDVPVRIEWPSGWARSLRMSIAPLADERDELGGAVIGFIDVQ